MLIADILRTKGGAVFTIEADRSIADAIGLLNEYNIGALVVVDANGDVTGIFSERDVIRHLSSGNATLLLNQKVSSCMTADPVTCRPNDTLDDMMTVMTDRRVRHMPICENKKLVGIVSIGDAVKRKIERTEEEAAALREYIAS